MSAKANAAFGGSLQRLIRLRVGSNFRYHGSSGRDPEADRESGGNDMNPRDIHAFFAATLLVSLGLGLIYLYAMDRIPALTVFAILLGGGVAIGILVAIRELADARRNHRDHASS